PIIAPAAFHIPRGGGGDDRVCLQQQSGVRDKWRRAAGGWEGGEGHQLRKAISKDGTPIAFDTLGTGPPIILVDGAFCTRSFGPMPKLAPLLAPHFTVFTYDRRGRGDSGDTPPYAVEREIE